LRGPSSLSSTIK
jgi:hypothetical protein